MAATSPAAAPPFARTLQRYFDVALYLLVLTGFGALASTGGLDLPAVILVGSALLWRGYLIARNQTLSLPERWTSALTLGYMVFYIADLFVISGQFLSATVHLVLFVMVVRLYSARRDRDYYFLAVIAFLMVLAAAVLTVGSVFLVTFAVFMLVAVVTFILMEMRSAAAKSAVHSHGLEDEAAVRRMALGLAGASPVMAVFILLGAGAIFFVLPRVSAGYLSAYSPPNELSTGFSDRVQLGGIGQIQQSHAVVMHIQIDGDKDGGSDLKWRGVTLNVFDGKTSSNAHEKVIVPPLPDGRFSFWQAQIHWHAPAEDPQKARPVHYRVLMEPVGVNLFFLAATPHTLQGGYRMIAVDRGNAVFNMDGEHPVAIYEAWSNTAKPTAPELRAANEAYPPEVLRDYLQLPPLDLRIPQLAQQIAGREKNNYDKAAALTTYLKTRFGYTLQLPRESQRDPLANFLFERKEGHCEYFASSLAVMLRSMGIPSRVINGFRGGEFNDLTSQYLVRESDAHAWVEAYFPGKGWVEFDPTPAGNGTGDSAMGRMALYLDAMSSFWREWVVNYDTSHQTSLSREVGQSGKRIRYDLQDWGRRHYQSWLQMARRAQDGLSSSPMRWSVRIAAVIVVLGFVANARRMWRALRVWRVAANPAKSPGVAATIWYERMLRAVSRRGWRKTPQQTPSEFMACIEDEAMRARVVQFTRRYESARFGESAEDAQRLPELYEEINSVARR